MLEFRLGLERAPEPKTSTWQMTLAADWAPIGTYEKVMRQQPEAVYGDLLPLLRKSDLNVVNVEAVLGGGGSPIAKAGPHLRCSAEAVAALQAAPFHIACLANNHAMDFGPDGLQSTLAMLTAADIDAVGTGMNRAQIERPIIRQVMDTRVAIINCAEGESGRSIHGEPGVQGHDAAKIGQQIRRLKTDDEADVVVVIFHGGREHAPVPPYVVRQLRQIAEAGADAVVAHHPHVPQGIEIHHGMPIAYSLGNFAFWQDSQCAFRRIGYLVHLSFAGSALAGCAVTPYVLRPDALQRLLPDQHKHFAAAMDEVTAPLRSDEQTSVCSSASFMSLTSTRPRIPRPRSIWTDCDATRRMPSERSSLCVTFLFPPAMRRLLLFC